MPSEYKVTCIRKTGTHEPHDCIHGIGGRTDNGNPFFHTVAEAINQMDCKFVTYYTDEGGKRANLTIAEHNENRYLKTQNDDVHPNNLLSLPECPSRHVERVVVSKEYR